MADLLTKQTLPGVKRSQDVMDAHLQQALQLGSEIALGRGMDPMHDGVHQGSVFLEIDLMERPQSVAVIIGGCTPDIMFQTRENDGWTKLRDLFSRGSKG